MRPAIRRALPFLLAVAWSGCTEKKVNDFVNHDLSGRIGGVDWIYRHAYIDPTVETQEDEDLVFVFLTYVPKKPCPKPGMEPQDADDRSVMVSAPKDKKLIKLKRGSSRQLVFHFEDKKGGQVATVAKKGKIKLTEINGDKVKGKIYAEYNDGNWVSGNFEAVMCEYGDFK